MNEGLLILLYDSTVRWNLNSKSSDSSRGVHEALSTGCKIEKCVTHLAIALKQILITE